MNCEFGKLKKGEQMGNSYVNKYLTKVITDVKKVDRNYYAMMIMMMTRIMIIIMIMPASECTMLSIRWSQIGLVVRHRTEKTGKHITRRKGRMQKRIRTSQKQGYAHGTSWYGTSCVLWT